MNDNNEKEGFVETDRGLSAWFDNFWYHYKTHAIIASVAIITVLICSVQMLTKENYDYYTMYAGPQILAVQDIAYIERSLAEVATDQNKDDKVSVALNDIVFLSDEEVAAAKEAGAVFDAQFIRKTRNEFYQQILAGDVFLFMLSPSVYEELLESDTFVPLADMLDELPDSAYDAHGIVLSKTDFGKTHNGIDDLPEDTILCIRRITSVAQLRGSEKAEKLQQSYIELFRNIVAYSDSSVDSSVDSTIENQAVR